MKNLTFTALLLIIPFYLWAQEAKGQTTTNNIETTPSNSEQPFQERQQKGLEKQSNQKELTREQKDLPNYFSLFFDWGFDFLRENPPAMKLNLWGSRVANFYLVYNIRIKRSHFTITPGIGLGYEGYSFKKYEGNYHTLVRDRDSRETKFQSAAKLLPQSSEIKNSSLDLRYVDLILEARFNTNRTYPKEGFFIAIGGKVGLLWSPSTTVTYLEDEQNKKRIMVDRFNLDRTRYVVHGKLGWKRFSIFYAHTLSNLFDQEKGPEGTEAKSCSTGLSIDLF